MHGQQNTKFKKEMWCIKHITNNFWEKFKLVYKSDIHAETSSTLPSTDSEIKILSRYDFILVCTHEPRAL